MTVWKWARSMGAVLVWVAWGAARLEAGQEDVIARARAAALAGQRAESITLLQNSLAIRDNSDARVLLGTVLSWEGRYDDARAQLEPVLAGNPTHGDAIAAMINVELWSSHPDRAEELASRALRGRPNDTALLFARARALRGLERQEEARDTLDRLLLLDPRHVEARELRRTVREGLRVWQVKAGSLYQGFSDRRVGWREADVTLLRATPIGSVSLSAVRAQRFGREDNQFEIEVYPRIRPGTYGYLAGAYSPDAVLFPVYRYAADLYQSLGGGFEGTAGFRKLGFGTGVNIYTGALSKYYGAWLFTGRTYITPKAAGTSRSYHGSFRRYFGESGAFAGLRYGRGGSRAEVRNVDDFEVLDSDVVAGEALFVLRRRLDIGVRSSYSREDRVERRALRQYAVSTTLGVRF